jgi:cardiolipin synthase
MKRSEEPAMSGKRRSELWTLPNILSLARILLTPVFVWAAVGRRPWLAFGVFLLAGATDALDGFTARVFGLRTNLGVWLDPIGDKVLLTTTFVILTFPKWSAPNALPIWLTAVCIGRDVLIAVGALIYVLIRGRTLFRPTLLGKASTITEVTTLLVLLLLNGLGRSPSFLTWLYLLTAGLAGLSGVHYIFTGVRRFFAGRNASGA